MSKSQNQNIRHSSQEELTKLGAVDAIDYVINAIRTEGTIKMGLPEVCNNSQVEVKEQGADVNVRDKSGQAALHYVVEQSKWDIAEC